jgi:NTP pyrophosphatase (non-canonical NTP hydrolase)
LSESVRYDIVQAYSKLVEDLIITSGDFRLIENTLGLCGESGEIAEKIKKYFRDEDYSKEDIVKELGDVLFYVTALTNHIGSDLETVMRSNIKKLQDRKKRNKIQGSGDNR